MRRIIDEVECGKCPVRKRCEEIIDMESRCPLAVKVDSVMMFNLLAEGKITWEQIQGAASGLKVGKS